MTKPQIPALALTAMVLLVPSPRAAAQEGRAAAARATPARVARALERDRRRLTTIRKEHRRGRALVRQGLSTRKTSSAVRALEAGRSRLERARTMIDRWRLVESADPVISELAVAVASNLREHLVDANLHLASVHLVRGAYTKALAAANLALSLEPRSRDALDQRARIETAAAESRGYAPWYRLRLRPRLVGPCSGARFPILDPTLLR